MASSGSSRKSSDSSGGADMQPMQEELQLMKKYGVPPGVRSNALKFFMKLANFFTENHDLDGDDESSSENGSEDPTTKFSIYMRQERFPPRIISLTEMGLKVLKFIDHGKSKFEQSTLSEGAKLGDSLSTSSGLIQYKPYEFPGIDLSTLPGTYEQLPLKLLAEPILYSQMLGHILKGVLATYNMVVNTADGESKWLAIFNPNHFPMPPTIKSIVETWKDDYEFCRGFLQGVNPFLIKIVGDISEIPEEMRELMAPPDSTSSDPLSVEALIAMKRLLIADYSVLAVTEPTAEGYYVSSSDKTENIFYAPYVLMYRTTEHTLPVGHNLRPLGIQLTRLSCGNQVFTPNSNSMNWLYAKVLVQNADSQYMEFVTHLGLGHLTMEPIVVAYYNWVKKGTNDNKNALIRKMLGPHMNRTFAINVRAKKSLMAKEAPSTMDDFMSAGLENGMKSFAAKFQSLEFSDLCFPDQLKKRGFDRNKEVDGVKGYFFRDDGYQLWDALLKYVQRTVNHCYQTDNEVAQDDELLSFFTDVGDPNKGNIPAFRGLSVSTRQHVTEVLTTIIFHASAFHAVQNNAQFDYFGFIPNKPMAVTYHPIDDPELTLEKIYATLPSGWIMLKQIVLTYILASNTVDNLDKLNVLQDCLPTAHYSLMKDFASLSSKIKQRNFDCLDHKEVPYPYFLPEYCNASVNI